MTDRGVTLCDMENKNRPDQKLNEIRFRDGGEILTLYVEKAYADGWTIGYCPERQNGMAVHPENVVSDD